MSIPRQFQFLAGVALVLCFTVMHPLLFAEAAPPATVREPAVAGIFYPKDKIALSCAIETYLAAAKIEPVDGELKALVCPHAGYSYSGPVAATAYRLLAGHRYDTVIVLGPSHYAYIENASVSGAAFFRTPLGDVRIDTDKAKKLTQLSPFMLETATAVQRPDWWRQASCPAPAPAADTAHTWEHSVEVQVPFLQKTLENFSLLPVVFGEVDPEKAAAALTQVLDENTLLVASSDLSHYDRYANAQRRDRRCIEAICGLQAEKIAPDDACGAVPIRTLIYVARAKGWKAKLLDNRNSGDTSGDKSRGVVGYAAIAFYAPSPASATQPVYNLDDRRFLLNLARKAVREAAASGRVPEIDSSALAPRFTTKSGCFVTLTKDGDLRGCIGNIAAQKPLVSGIIDNARAAAIHDTRFHRVSAAVVDQLEIEISVLTEPLPLSFSSPADLLTKLQPGRDGVVLQIGQRAATYLPQVWAQLPDKVEFLDTLAEKAGCARSAWRSPEAKVSVYRVESFKESELPAQAR